MTHAHEGDAAGTQPAAPPGDFDRGGRLRGGFWLPSDPDLDVFRPARGSSPYLPAGHVLVSTSSDHHTPPAVDFNDSAAATAQREHLQRAVDGFTLGLSMLDLELLLAVSRLFDGTHGRRAPARGLVQQAARHDRNARGFVPGAHPAARPMHEAYRARRRRRSGRR